MGITLSPKKGLRPRNADVGMKILGTRGGKSGCYIRSERRTRQRSENRTNEEEKHGCGGIEKGRENPQEGDNRGGGEKNAHF